MLQESACRLIEIIMMAFSFIYCTSTWACLFREVQKQVKGQIQRCDKSAMTLQIGVATHFQASPLISMRTESLVSSQSCGSIDADAWCKRGLALCTEYLSGMGLCLKAQDGLVLSDLHTH